jgi:hypothetical protein
MVFRKSEFDEIERVPAELLIRVVDTQFPTLLGEFRRWNDHAAGVVVGGKRADLVNIVRAIAAGRNGIKAGYRIGNSKDTDDFSSSGSANALNEVITVCKLDKVKKTPKVNTIVAAHGTDDDL